MEQESTDMILSIKPIYVEKILQGVKKIEFRKTIPKRRIKRVFIYSSKPVMMVIGYFLFSHIEIDTPKVMWKNYSDVAGIEENEFFKYYATQDTAVGFLISEVIPFSQPLPISRFNLRCPPQSYCYLGAVNGYDSYLV